MTYTRTEVVQRINKKITGGHAVLASGSGIGISAKFAEKGGTDLVVIYNSGRYRMMGHNSWSGYLPIGDANAIVLEMGEREVLPLVKETPVIAGVFASDPTRRMDHFLKQVKDMGFSGVINFPTVAILEGNFRDNMETSGLGFAREVEMIRIAHSMELYTMAYVFNAEESEQMAEAGVDCIVAHMGNTAGGTVGQVGGVFHLQDAVRLTREIAMAAQKINPEIVVLCHGGPIALPADAEHVIQEAGIQGFVGASSMERLPVEEPLTKIAQAFSNISLKR